MPRQKESSKREILDTIIEEARYRPVIPFLGAGISISAGFPTIRFVTQYLAKVDFAIRFGVYKNRLPGGKNQQEEFLDDYRRHPSKFLEDFGWPNFGQIDADLWAWLGHESTVKQLEGEGEGEGEGRRIIREKIPKILAQKYSLIDDITTIGNNTGLDYRDHLKAIVQWNLRQNLSDQEAGTKDGIINEWIKWKKFYHKNNYKNNSEPSLLYGNWEILLDKLSEGNHELVDSLFTSFGNGLYPSISHRLLAFLQPKLEIPLILTTNFDSLLEKSFYEEGLIPKIFDVHRDAQLPDPALVRKQLSIIKLHGSAYGLRLGERLKQPLELSARNNALQYIEGDPLLLVLGFSGSERRMMQMLQAFSQHRRHEENPRLIWVQGPSEPGPLFDELFEGEPLTPNDKRIQWCKVKHADTFLQELYFNIAHCYQSSSKSYLSLPGELRMTEIDLSLPSSQPKDNRYPIQIFVAKDANKLNTRTPSTSWATLAGVAFTQTLSDYTIIWIDLENHHTVEGIVSEFFNRVRKIDPTAPSCVMADLHNDNSNQNTQNTNEIQKAVNRIKEVFQRGRYALVLDSIESFGRPQMVHHGVPSYDYSEDKNNVISKFKIRIKHLEDFLKTLICNNLDDQQAYFYLDSYVIITIDKPRARHGIRTNLETLKSINKLVTSLTNDKSKHSRIIFQDERTYSDIIKNSKIKFSDNPSKSLPKHWKPIHNKPYNAAYLIELKNNSIKRIHDVIYLFSYLNPKFNKSYTNKIRLDENNYIPTLLGILSVFRRPRTIPIQRSIIGRWALRMVGTKRPTESDATAAYKCIDDMLEVIAPSLNKNHIKYNKYSPFGMRHEGGSIWLFRESQENIYDSFTESLRLKYWRTNIDDNLKISALLDGMLCISWQLLAARTYYVNVFMPTQDISAFYEYIYHRTSAIRYITFLIILLNSINSDSLNFNGELYNELLNDSVEASGVFSQLHDDESRNCYYNNYSDKSFFLRRLHILRQSALETLLMALKRNHPRLRAESIPDTISAWASEFINNEITAISGNFIENKTGAYKEYIEKNQEILDELKEIFEYLDFQAKLSKFDFDAIFEKFKSSYLNNQNKSCNNEIDQIHLNRQENERLHITTNTIKELEINVLSWNKYNGENNNINQKKNWNKIKYSLNNVSMLIKCLFYRDSSPLIITEFSVSIRNIINKLENQLDQDWIQSKLRNTYSISCGAKLEVFPYWEQLLKRQLNSWFYQENLDHENEKILISAEEESITYEDMLRETTKTKEEDSKHRASAFILRARSLYLQGHFRQAHHYLDLAPTGLILERFDHRKLIAAIHITRAELLAISAHKHYQKIVNSSQEDASQKHSFNKLKNEVNASLKKIDRAEQELRISEEILNSMKYNTNWIIKLEFGWAQTILERMLFEIELLYLEWPELDNTNYLQRTGKLEQKILEGMKRLRNILDMIPYTQVTDKKDITILPPYLVKIERNAYILWKQFFVVGAYYTGILSNRKKGPTLIERKDTYFFNKASWLIPGLDGYAVTSPMAREYEERWKQWCNAMRFERLGSHVQLEKSLRADNAQKFILSKGVFTLRSLVIQTMENECSENKIDDMWNHRRNNI